MAEFNGRIPQKPDGNPLSQRDFLKDIGIIAAATTIELYLRACRWRLQTPTPTPSAAPEPIKTSSPLPDATPTFQPNPDVNIDTSLPSPYSGFYFGQEKGTPGTIFVGAIKGTSFETNNSGYYIPQFDGVHESRLNYLYSQDSPDQTTGFLIDSSYLMQVFKATDSKGGVIGTLPDGTAVEYKNGLWEATVDGKTKYFNPLFTNQKGKPFGYPVFADDNQGNFYTGICFDENGVLVTGKKMETAFKTAGQIAWEAGYSGDLTKIASVRLNDWGNIVVYDTLGNQISVQPYLNPNAPAESFSTPTPTATATPTEVPPPEELNSLPPGIIAVSNVDGTWGVGIDEGDQTKAIQGISVDAAGFHLASDNGQIDIATAEIAKRLKMGQASPLQIYNESETAILYAFDAENKAWVDAADVLQSDKSNPENFIHIKTMDALVSFFKSGVEKMFLLPFDPNKTYFPPLDKIWRDYESIQNNPGDPNAEFNRYTPFGRLPDGMQSPFRFPNFIILEKNQAEGRQYDGIIYTEQIFNPDDGSFSVIYCGPKDIDMPVVIEGNLGWASAGKFSLPYSSIGKDDTKIVAIHTTVTWLQKNDYIDISSGQMPKIRSLVEEWFDTGHVPAELEGMPLLCNGTEVLK